MQQTLSPRDVAQALGVSESSIKRWADEGRIRAFRTAGGHRRISVAEAVRFVHRTQAPVVDPGVLQLQDVAALKQRRPPAGREAEELYGYLKDGASVEARGLIEGLFLDGWSLARIADGPICEVMERIGREWEHSAEGIFWEHRATQICIQSIHQLILALTPEADAPCAVGGAVSGDPYILPSLIASAVLTAEGWRAVNLGPQTPADTLLIATRDLSPQLVWLSISTTPEPEATARDIQGLLDDLSPRRIPLAVGGRSLPDMSRETSARLTACETMAELAAFARGLKTAGRKQHD